MRKFVLIHKNEGCFFSDPKRDSENEVFTDKQRGVEILIEWLKSHFISKCNALELLESLIALRSFPISPVSKNNQLEADRKSLEFMAVTRALFKRLSLSESEVDLPKLVVCPNCGDHGGFVGKDFVTPDFTNQKDAYECVEDLFDTGQINRDEKKEVRN